MTLIIDIIGIFYILAAAFVWLGLWLRQKPADQRNLSSGSLIVCARDEGKDLPACLESIERQTLGPDRLEIILVNDASEDGTGQLMDEYAQRSRYPVQVLHMPPPEPGEPSGKWRPLKEGIRLASHEGLLLTDADAILAPTWAEKHLEELGKSQMAAGFALIEGEGLWGRIQCLDWLFLLGVGSSLAHWGTPQAALGKNLSVRRADYDAVGGLEAIGFSLTEDRALIQAVVRNGAKVSFPLDVDMSVRTPGVHTWGEFLHQRKRWASGIRGLKPAGKICMTAMTLRHFGVIIGVLAFVPEALWVWAATAAANFFIQQKIAAKLKQRRRLWYFIFWEIFYTWTAPAVAYRLLSNRRVEWKGRKFPRSTQPAESA